MSLVATIKQAAQAAFDAAGDVKYNASYLKSTGNAYNPATGAVSSGTTSYPVEGVLYGFEINQVDGNTVFPADQQFIFMADQIDFTPHVNDLVRIDGTDWQVQNFSKDPAGVTCTLHLRKP